MRLAFALLFLTFAGCVHSGGTGSERREESAARPEPLLMQTVKGRMGLIKRCYEKALKEDLSLKGKVVIGFQILPDGTLADVAVVSDTMGSTAVADCVVEEMRGWRTQLAPRDPVKVEFPFVFNPVK